MQGEYHGAYRIDVATTEGPADYVYCLGRGVVMDGGTACRTNLCDEKVFHFIAFGAAATDDDICLHTCYRAGTG